MIAKKEFIHTNFKQYLLCLAANKATRDIQMTMLSLTHQHNAIQDCMEERASEMMIAFMTRTAYVNEINHKFTDCWNHIVSIQRAYLYHSSAFTHRL